MLLVVVVIVLLLLLLLFMVMMMATTVPLVASLWVLAMRVAELCCRCCPRCLHMQAWQP